MKFAILIILLFASSFAFSQRIMIFGGEKHDMYLGCLNCAPSDDESIWNENGVYGTKLNNLSIWSEFSDYGNEFSYLSPWNEFATAPPIITDDKGGYYGYFTRNPYNKERTEVEFFVYVLENFRWISEHFPEFIKGLHF
jgi:hypothetical protein